MRERERDGEVYGKSKGKFYPRTDHEGLEGE